MWGGIEKRRAPEAERPFPIWVPALWGRERRLHWDSFPSLPLPEGKLGFQFLSSCAAAVRRPPHLCRTYRRGLPRRRTPGSLHLGSQHTSIAPNLLKDLSRGCTAEVPLPHAPWPGPWLVCLAQRWLLATSFIPFFANIEVQRSAAPR